MTSEVRTANRVPSVIGRSSASNVPVVVYADPTTHRLYVDASISSYTGVTDGEDVNAAYTGTLILGTDGTHYQVLVSDSDGHLQVDILNTSIAVTGTVTANLSDTDNAVLDVIAAGYATEGDALGDGVLIQGDDGANRTNVLVDDAGHLQIDVVNTSIAVTGAFYQTTQPVSLASVPSHAVTNAGTFAVQVDGTALTALQLTDDMIYTDDTSTHATGTSKGALIMAAATPTDGSVDVNDIGAIAMSVDRRMLVDAQIVGTDAALNCSGATITIQGTVTAELSSTDNSVLDNIATSLAIMDDWDAPADHVNIRHLSTTDDACVVDLGTNNDVTLTGGGGVTIKDDTIYGDAITTGILSVGVRLWNGTNYDRWKGDTTDGALVNTELPAAAALSDTTGNPTSPMVGAALMIWDGSSNWMRGRQIWSDSDGLAGVNLLATSGFNLVYDPTGDHQHWDRMVGDGTNGLLVNLGSNNDVTVTAKSLDGSGAPTVDSYAHLAINLDAAANQVLVSSAANKQIWVYGVGFTLSVDGTVSFQDEDDAAITGIMPFAATSGMAIPPSGNFAMPIWKLATNKDLEIDVVTASIDGWIDYAIVSV